MLSSVVPCYLVQKPAEKPGRINDREGGYLVQQPTELMEETEGEDTSSVDLKGKNTCMLEWELFPLTYINALL